MSRPFNELTSRTDLEYNRFDQNSLGEVVVRTIDKDAIDLLNQMLAALGGGSSYLEKGQAVSDGTLQTLVSFTVAAGITSQTISRVSLAYSGAGSFFVYRNGSLIGSGRLRASQPNVKFLYSPPLSLSSGDLIEVKFQRTYGPAQDVEAYVTGSI